MWHLFLGQYYLPRILVISFLLVQPWLLDMPRGVGRILWLFVDPCINSIRYPTHAGHCWLLLQPWPRCDTGEPCWLSFAGPRLEGTSPQLPEICLSYSQLQQKSSERCGLLLSNESTTVGVWSRSIGKANRRGGREGHKRSMLREENSVVFRVP